MFTTSAIGRENVVLKSIRDNRLLVGLVAAHLVLAFLAAMAFRIDFDSYLLKTIGGRLGELMPLFLGVLLMRRHYHFLRHARRGARRESSLRWLAGDLRETLTDTSRMAGGLVALVAISLFCTSFGILKSVIPMIQPFYLDEAFARLDRALHLGRDPWVLLLPLFELPLLVTLVNGAYHFWAILLFFLVFVACFTGVNPQARATFLVGFVLVWALGGNLLATVLSSAGPVFYDKLGYGDAFLPLLAALEASNEISPVSALELHRMLWDGYTANGPNIGISAMPSMHVASSTLFALYAFTWRRWAGWLLVGFTAVIQLGSVLLAWHYAIDGYLGVLVALGCWRLAMWMTGGRRTAGAEG